jgi:hypothetical protein
MRIPSVVLLLLANASAIRLYAPAPTAVSKETEVPKFVPGLIVPDSPDDGKTKKSHDSIDSEGRAKSESMPQYGGTATDDSKKGENTHIVAKMDHKDVANYKELSDNILKNSTSVRGSLSDHL